MSARRFLLRSRPAVRCAHPLCASHRQAPHTGRLSTTAQIAIATGPSSPANTDAATVIAPRAMPAHQAPRRYPAGFPRFLEPKVGRPVIVTQPAGFQTGSAVVDRCRLLRQPARWRTLPAGAPSPLAHPPAAPAENPYSHPRSRKASRSTPGGAYQPSAPYLAPRPNARSLFPYGIRSGVGDPSFDCGPPADAPVLSC